jgi:hypothetical protein
MFPEYRRINAVNAVVPSAPVEQAKRPQGMVGMAGTSAWEPTTRRVQRYRG